MDDPNKNDSRANQPKVIVEDVQRVLEVGRLLKSVLTEEELEELAKAINASQNKADQGGECSGISFVCFKMAVSKK